MIKKVYNPKSKTHNVAMITAIVGGLLTFAPQIMAFIPGDWYGPIFIGLGVAHIILRNVTTTPIEEK